jgi:TolA-binding protein
MATKSSKGQSSTKQSKVSGKSASMSGPLFDLLKEDHDRVKGLFEQIEDSEDDAESREELFSQIREDLEIHMEGEETYLYPALEEHEDTKELALEAYEEHHVAKTVLSEVIELDQEDERWKAKMKVLKELIEHHIQEEEGELFKLTKKVLPKETIQEISDSIEQLKSRAA